MIRSKNTSGERSRAGKWYLGKQNMNSFKLLDDAYRYGHGVLRSPDPRFVAIQEFCLSRPELKESPIIELIQKVNRVSAEYLLLLTCNRRLRLLPRFSQSMERSRFLYSSLRSCLICRKTKNPHPNVDATSGCVLYHYGVTEFKVSEKKVMPLPFSSVSSTTLSFSVCREVRLSRTMNLDSS